MSTFKSKFREQLPLTFGQFIQLCFALALCTLLAACGGGGGGTGSNPQPVLSITAQPTDQSAVEGTATTFSVQASGDATFQWQRLEAGAWISIPAAAAASFTTAVLRPEDSGTRFRVTVASSSNPAHSIVSSVVTLTVTAIVIPPSILVQPQDLTRVAGENASLSVTATGTTLSYQWQRSHAGQGWVDIVTSTTATLVLPSLAESDNGSRYRVFITNSAGNVTSDPALLSVIPAPAAPLYTLEPQPAATVVGQAAIFTVAVTGVPAPTLRWQVSRDAGGLWDDMAGETHASVAVIPTSVADNGLQYRTIATNPSGSVTSATASLAVEPAPAAPTIKVPPASVTVGLAGIPVFSVVAEGWPMPTYQWQVSVDDGTTFSNITGSTNRVHIAPPATVTDDGRLFRVATSNASGTAVSAAARLHVTPAPVVTQHPVSQWWRPGKTSATFAASATGRDLHYQWQTSTDGCSTFSNVGDATREIYVHAAQAASKVDCVRVIVTNGGGSTTSWSALLRTTFSYVNPTPTGEILVDLEWLNANTVLALGKRAVLRSEDAGQSWDVVEEHGPMAATMNGMAFNGQGTGLIVGNGRIIRRTTDGGTNWTTVSPFAPDRYNPVEFSAVAFAGTGVAVVGSSTGEFFRSADAGLTWVPAVVTGQAWRIASVAFNSNVSVGVAVGASGLILRTIDAGMHWVVVAPPSTQAELRSVTFASDDTVVALGSNGKVLRSIDAGQTWVEAAYPGSMSDLHFADAMHGIIVTDEGTVYRTSDGAASWQAVPGVAPYVLPMGAGASAVRFGSADVLIAVAGRGQIWRSADSGQTWQGLPSSSAMRAPLTGVAFSSSGNGVAVGLEWVLDHRCGPFNPPLPECSINSPTSMQAVVLHSADAGRSWRPAQVNSPPKAVLRVVAFADANTVVAVGDRGAAIRSVDGGRTWKSVVSFLGNDWVHLHGIAFASPQVGIALAWSGVVRSTDGGEHWSLVEGVEPDLISVSFGNENVGVGVGLNGVIRRTTDGGLTWQLVASPTSRTLSSVHFVDAQTVVATGGMRTMLRSTDSGQTWTTATVRESGSETRLTPDRGFGRVAFSDANHGVARAYEPWGLLVTRDGGLSWDEDANQLDGWVEYIEGFDFTRDGALVLVGVGSTDSRASTAGGVILLNERY